FLTGLTGSIRRCRTSGFASSNRRSSRSCQAGGACPSRTPVERTCGVHSVLVLGAGKIGRAIAKLLAHSGDYDVLVGDADEGAWGRLAPVEPLRTARLDVTEPAALDRAMEGRQSVVSACSFSVNPGIARAALKAGVSYFDLTEDLTTTRIIRELAADARP